MEKFKYDNYKIKVKDSSLLLSKNFIRKSDVLTNLIYDTYDDSNIIIFPDDFDIESLKKCYDFYKEIKDLTIKDLQNNDVLFVDYIENNLGDIKERYSSKNIKIPCYRVFKKYSESKDFVSNLGRIIKINDFLNLQSITRMMAPIISNLLINLPYNNKVKIFKKMRIRLKHLNPDPEEI